MLGDVPDEPRVVIEVGADDARDGQAALRTVDDLDVVPGPDGAWLFDRQVAAESPLLLEALHERGVAHAHAELEARQAGLGDPEAGVADGPELTDQGGVE